MAQELSECTVDKTSMENLFNVKRWWDVMLL